MLYCYSIQAQGPSGGPSTLNYGFPTAFDRFGNQFPIYSLLVNNTKPLGGTATVQALPTYSCFAGYFDLYYAAGSIFDGSSATAVSARSVMCEVFDNISGLLASTLPPTTRINIFCTNHNGALAAASPFFVFPVSPSNPNPGLIDNQIYKAITSGIDPYTNVPVSTFANAGNFYHGYIYVNPNYSWNWNMSTTSLASTDYDAYTVFLHEVIHSLGFASLISYTGNSLFGATNNYYARFDKFLSTPSGAPLIGNVTNSCTPNYIQFLPSNTVIASTGTVYSSGNIPDVTTCSNAVQYISSTNTVAIYTPSLFTNGSSLSHFEDMCSGVYSGTCTPSPISPGSNNLIYVMSNVNNSGSCFVKRYPRTEERNVFCDLGYSVNPTFTSNAAGATFSYGSSCNPVNIIGLNDGFVNGTYVFTTTGTSYTIPINTLLANDTPSASLQVSCVEIVYSTITTQNITYTQTATNLIVGANAGAGQVLLKYYPRNVNTGEFGNATYIFIYFVPGNCNPPNYCNLIQNGGFEFQPTGSACGGYFFNGITGFASLNCWERYSTGAVGGGWMYSRNCNTPTGFNIPNSIYTPALDSYNGTPNDKYFMIQCSVAQNPPWSAAPKNKLSSQLIPGNVYQLTFWTINPPVPWNGAATSPAVIAIGSEPSFNTPVVGNVPSPGLNIITQLTINPTATWSLVTVTFTFSSPGNLPHESFIIGLHQPNTEIAANYVLQNKEVYIDDVSLILASATPTFVVPTNTTCALGFTDLAQYASPISGYFSGPGVSTVVTGSVTQYNFNSPATLPGGQSYAVAFNYTNSAGCAGTVWQNIAVPGISTGMCLSGYTFSAFGFPSTATFTWLPGSINTSTFAATPLTTTTYTLLANYGSCQLTRTLTNVKPCCPALFPSQLTTLTTSLTSGPLDFVNNVTVTANSSATLMGHIGFAPEVKLKVSSNATLELVDAHLLGCSYGLWEGIELADGAKLICRSENKHNLIEDAKIAVAVVNHSTSTLNPILDINYTTFNKNYKDILISNFQRTLTSYPFTIRNCVFTCRDLPYNFTTWPNTGTTNTTSSSSADLRALYYSATGLQSPYIGQSTFTVSNLKLPYSNQPSHIAIELKNVGLTNGTTYYGLNLSPIASDFNLFDSHGRFIDGENSNLILNANVFQNTLRYPASINNSTVIYGGEAVNSRITNYMNGSLDLVASINSTVNRFWNCHTGVSGNKLYRFKMENTSFRSVQSTSAIPSGTFVPQGNAGLVLNTNKFLYYIKNNEFTNINQCINIPLAAASSCSVCANLIYATNIAILQNTFSPGSGSGNYLGKAVNITSPNNFPLTVAPSSVAPYTQAISIEDNSINNAFRGIYVNGVTGFKTAIKNNTITLADDNYFTPPSQHGIELANTYAANDSSGVYEISGNVLSAQNLTNTAVSLVDCSINTGTNTPVVVCNALSNAYNGFVFNSTNDETIWGGNTMQPMARGLVLDQNGIIGQQGTGSTVANNKWNGTWTNPTNYATYVGVNSVAQNSPMWVKTGSTFPPTNNGTVVPSLWYNAANTLSVSTGNDYQCSGLLNNRPASVPNVANYSDAEAHYLAETVKYRFLHMNTGIMNSDPIFSTFYNAYQTANPGLLMDVEQNIYDGNVSSAATILSGITATNTIESNYVTFYQVYINYLSNAYDVDDSTDLVTLAGLCPGEEGGAVLQARALYNSIYNTDRIYPECGSAGGRPGKETTQSTLQKNETNWEVGIFPNPASNAITLISKAESEALKIEIRDVNSRLVLQKELKTSRFLANLELELINGVYFVTIKSAENETNHKKLLIAK